MTLRTILFLHRHKKACRKLQRIVEANRQSFATQDYAKRRKSALKATRARAG
jgi:hypothetical protein